MLKLVTCKKCGWVSFAISRKYAKAEAKKFYEFYKILPEEDKKCYGVDLTPESLMKHYRQCFNCNTDYKNFRKYKKTDIDINGHTIQPIIDFKE